MIPVTPSCLTNIHCIKGIIRLGAASELHTSIVQPDVRNRNSRQAIRNVLNGPTLPQEWALKLTPSIFALSCCAALGDSIPCFPQSSSEVVCSAGVGSRAPCSGSALKGQGQGPSGTIANTHISDSRPGCGQLRESAHAHHRPFTVAWWIPEPPGEGPRTAPVSVPEPATNRTAPCPGPRHGVLRALVLLLYLWLWVHQQRAADGAHEGAWGRHHQHHPEQGAAATRSPTRPPNSRVRRTLPSPSLC